MRRSGKVLAVCHCLLNANAKVRPLASCPGACMEALRPLLEDGAGLVQLPCPETATVGLARWGMTREQYDTPFLRRACRTMLQPALDQLAAHAAAGHEILGLAGVDGSPNCGISQTCEGFAGGEPGHPATDLPAQLAALRFVPGSGVFVQEFLAMAHEYGLNIPLWAVDERNPSRLRPVSLPG